MEGYRSGHNGAVLKTVRAKVHAGSNPAPSAKKGTPAQRAGVPFLAESRIRMCNRTGRGPVHEPVRTLANPSISFRISRQRKEMQANPAPSAQIAETHDD